MANAKLHHYATYFDQHYLTRGLVMLKSLLWHAPNASVWVLCLDDVTLQTLGALRLPRVTLLRIEDLEAADPELAATRGNRTKLEFYFTLTAPFLKWVFQLDNTIQDLAYVDADVCFFGNPEVILDEMGDRSIGIIDHRYPDFLSGHTVWGKYNVGIVTFRRSQEALACIDWWRERCIEWCYDRLESDRYADQKYLDQWPSLFPNVAVIEHPGVGVAPWNVPGCRISSNGAQTFVNGTPLIAYHYSRFRIIWGSLFDTGARWFGYKLSPVVSDNIYMPYAQQILRAAESLKSVRAQVAGPDTLQQRERRMTGLNSAAIQRVWVFLCALRRGSLLMARGAGLDPARESLQPALNA